MNYNINIMLLAPINNNNTLTLSSKLTNVKLFIPNIQYHKTLRKPLKIANTNTPLFEIVSHGIVYLSIFYCTLNYNYYRNIRLKAERKINLKDKSKKNRK